MLASVITFLIYICLLAIVFYIVCMGASRCYRRSNPWCVYRKSYSATLFKKRVDRCKNW